ncbi:hypothetical protein EB796_023275 [Bugula neritina]|uniref:Uncharacterized protein n=1 Tax=Bugula neritina TaxID=10212 RepID=A0A7J7IWX6_BUGNE|nr:hypothetical protein EB796_023275 [Bugula neritina]
MDIEDTPDNDVEAGEQDGFLDASHQTSFTEFVYMVEMDTGPTPSTITANGVNSSKLHIIGRTAAEITIGQIVFKQCFHVADDIGHEVLLGTGFPSKLGDVTYNFEKGEEASEVDEDGILMTNISEPKHDLGKTLDQSKTTLNDDEMNQLRNIVNEFSDIVGEGISELG